MAADIVNQLKLTSVSAGGAPGEDRRAISLQTVDARVAVAISNEDIPSLRVNPAVGGLVEGLPGLKRGRLGETT